MASNDVDHAGGKQGKQSGSRLQNFCRALYNPQTKEFFGRSCGSWAKIGVFYLVFYSCLAGFFAVMLVGFFSTLDDKEPTMNGMYSLIKNNPGMGFRPLESIESTLVKFNMSDDATYSDKIQSILLYLRENQYIDDKNESIPVEEGVFDFATISSSSGCTIDKDNVNKSFGYAKGEPCILLKINRVYNWMPEGFNETVSTEHGQAANKSLGSRYSPNYIGITCEGENDGDMDTMGPVVFTPDLGFPIKYFPFVNAEGYRAPLVWAKFTKPADGVLIQIWCKMWAKNVKHHKNDKAGSVRFELMMDNRQ